MAAVLSGITWGHSRGITPLLAASQRYEELHPGIQVKWTKRTLQEFADYPIETLTGQYDLLIIDHPWVGCAAATRCVLPLNEYLPAEYLQNQLNNSVGGSHESYFYDGGQWALAIDAATPAASYRKDLFEKHNQALPQNWEDVLQLAIKGKLALPAIPIDLLMNFYTFCLANGKEPFANEEELIDRETGLAAIHMMLDLYTKIDPRFFSANPIAVAELMSSSNDYWYCPLAYAYSNYARTGFAKYLLHYTDVVSFRGKKLSTTIGGTGIAVSASSIYPEIAIDFAQWVVTEEIQENLYAEHGGQPGHLKAWQNEKNNRLTHDFFQSVLPVMQNGYIRPRYNGYLHFQDHAGLPLQQCMKRLISPTDALDQMNHIYRQQPAHLKHLTQA